MNWGKLQKGMRMEVWYAKQFTIEWILDIEFQDGKRGMSQAYIKS